MSEIKCILDSSLVHEKKYLKEDLFRGISLDILILLLSGEKKVSDISRSLNVPIFSVMLYITRLIEGNLVEESKVISHNGTIEKVYRLSSPKLEIINKHKSDLSDEDSKRLECELMASHFSKLTTNSIKNIYKHSDKPYVIKSCFIKGNKYKMLEFQEKLNRLFEEFSDMEDENAKETYGFVVTFTPYSLE
ncbi:hypothetical protein [Caloranaerobacter azorensis]|uniref:Uncharacterized protein n=1 Tax=Caloranaerobacter azorensis TaxID=116090 RepID=A0A6P1YH18_9FIRM|nr:hypothetical protein [Caloranaerobacter azorensis]QIB28008.1 hypothetical protein G3A45_12425 [Caloranaerobacter azorensis]